MKKLLLVLLVVTLASFLFVGCLPTTPAEGEGEGEGEGEVGVTVEIADSVVVDGKTYVSAGEHDITVTFPAPVSGAVTAYIGFCSGDYSKGLLEDLLAAGGISVVLFPNEDKTIWTGSAEFLGWGLLEEPSGCCASYVFVSAGECEDETCIQFPVIVDACEPYAQIKLTLEEDYCVCGGCAVNFSSEVIEDVCAGDTECCGDDCSGLASWSITLYDGQPFDVCCDPSQCEVPIGSGSGTCPVDFTTECLTANTQAMPYYYAVIELVDKVGLKQTYYVRFTLAGGATTDADCVLEVFEGFEGTENCVDWNTVSDDVIGACESVCSYFD
ncbi:MAG TPA: hypothetical protein ENG48_10300 [Candidatus Atribacteria bacterium]|nr:hypothetical protein [Candidatus Atribacteria bacterium]